MKNYKVPVRKSTSRRKPSHDYLKYWRTIRYWVKAKYGLSTPDIEMMLFLYSENMFTKSKFKRYEQIMSWDINRFDRLLRDDWIHVWRKRKGKEATLYELTYKSKRIITLIYKKLNGEEVAETAHANPLFKDNANYMDKVYRQSIVEMNKFIKQQRHLALE
jgi:hypothetical protein|tara:strand:+ start:330 stop:812 length:483 start_codon:yes stop_codon:yes gene_type:complete